MTNDPIPLYIWQERRPTVEQTEALKRAKRASGLDVLVKPERAFAGCGRCISFDGRPPFASSWCEPDGYGDERLPKMIRWVIEGGDIPGPKRMEDWFTEVMGVEVREK